VFFEKVTKTRSSLRMPTDLSELPVFRYRHLDPRLDIYTENEQTKLWWSKALEGRRGVERTSSIEKRRLEEYRRQLKESGSVCSYSGKL
jgi:hypothetical protein